MAERDSMECDVLIVGAGPAGLSAAIRIKQLALEQGRDLSVCVLEKGSEVGAHLLSGAILDPVSLHQLIPNWRDKQAPLKTLVTEEHFYLLDQEHSFEIPQTLLPPMMRNHGHYIISLGKLCQWLAREAEELGVEVYPGFVASELLLNSEGALCGVITGDTGVDKNGELKSDYVPGMALYAKYTLIAEGARGSLAQLIEKQFDLRAGIEPQKYGIGFKELWQVSTDVHREGYVAHSLGWPLDDETGGGSFIYHLENEQVAVGFVVHLNYKNPYLNPFEEFQRFKTHPVIRPIFAGAKRLAYGARTINEGGTQSLPRLVFPGGALIGCSAGLVNVPRIKGIHNAIESGILGAKAVFDALDNGRAHDELTDYAYGFKSSRIWNELNQVRNVKPALSRFGTKKGMLYAGIEMWLSYFGLRMPWTLSHKCADSACLHKASEALPISYPKADGQITFDRLSSIYLANVAHEENQPCHLVLHDPSLALSVNLQKYDAPEQRYCPAAVYEIVEKENHPSLQINASNCIHCKACEIKDPSGNILWKPPEGGGGPNYQGM
ncbi:MAG: 4Fe-4S dicluster domain-containing protein [Proteobacteria bacterium]|nr:4Fe-4S dicluster domain-containing protein [Pseudomonadota bacterium]